jgi:hypothetical protein
MDRYSDVNVEDLINQINTQNPVEALLHALLCYSSIIYFILHQFLIT